MLPGQVPCCTVKHQSLHLTVSPELRAVWGFTELKVAPPSAGQERCIGLHARGLAISRVLVDGVESLFQLRSRHVGTAAGQCTAVDKKAGRLLQAADAALKEYVAALEDELSPELVVQLPDPQPVTGATHDTSPLHQHPQASALGTSAATSEEEVLQVRVEYRVDSPSAGLHFYGHTVSSHSQVRRARCWFPCHDSPLHRSSFDLTFTVPPGCMAISSGHLLTQKGEGEGQEWREFRYEMKVAVAAEAVVLVVGPLAALPDEHHPAVLHMAAPPFLPAVRHTMAAFNSIFRMYEEYLGAPFPFGCYRHVVIDSNAAVSSYMSGASTTIISADLLHDNRIIDQASATFVKLARALACQWFGIFITAESPADEWLLEGLAGHLVHVCIKRFLGDTEDAFRRCQTNEMVCFADVDGAPALSRRSSSSSSSHTGGAAGAGGDDTRAHRLGIAAPFLAFKAVAVTEMLEKQMGADAFRKVLQRIVLKAHDVSRRSRTLSTRDFRHFANKLGNLERPFLKDFFPRWVDASGCPRLRMGYACGRRRNVVELAVLRSATSQPCPDSALLEDEDGHLAEEVEAEEAEAGWPGMMTVRLQEAEGPFEHPCLPLGGDPVLLLELQCHSKVSLRRTGAAAAAAAAAAGSSAAAAAGAKKGGLAAAAAVDTTLPPAGSDAWPNSVEMAVQWLHADPESEYLGEVHVRQPLPMWAAQLGAERSVVGQLQAISALRSSSASPAALSALLACLSKPQVFWRVRQQAAAAIAQSGGGAGGGLDMLLQLYRTRCFDSSTALPRPHDFSNMAEYFVNQGIVVAVAAVRGPDGFSPPDAAHFLLLLLKHNDNSKNAYSDVHWVACLLDACASLHLAPQHAQLVQRLLKQLDRYLQYDRIVPSYGAMVSARCISALCSLALQAPPALLARVGTQIEQVLLPLAHPKTSKGHSVRVAAVCGLQKLKLDSHGMDAMLRFTLSCLALEKSFLVQGRVMEHATDLALAASASAASSSPEYEYADVSAATLKALGALMRSAAGFANVRLRHASFGLLQALAARPSALVPSGEGWGGGGGALRVRIPLSGGGGMAAAAALSGGGGARIEPLRIRRGPSGLSLSTPRDRDRDMVPSASNGSTGTGTGSAGGSRVVVKLRLQPPPRPGSSPPPPVSAVPEGGAPDARAAAASDAAAGSPRNSSSPDEHAHLSQPGGGGAGAEEHPAPLSDDAEPIVASPVPVSSAVKMMVASRSVSSSEKPAAATPGTTDAGTAADLHGDDLSSHGMAAPTPVGDDIATGDVVRHTHSSSSHRKKKRKHRDSKEGHEKKKKKRKKEKKHRGVEHHPERASPVGDADVDADGT